MSDSLRCSTFAQYLLFSSCVARNQINKFSNGQWKRAATYTEAILTWNDMCATYHQHSNASSPPSTPSPPHLLRTWPRQHPPAMRRSLHRPYCANSR
jgi:hypothetical protein